MCGGKPAHDACPDPRSPPTNETIVAGCAGAIGVWKIAPRRTRSQYPEDAIENTPVIHAGNAARLIREHHSNGTPFAVGKLVSHDWGLFQLEAAQHSSSARQLQTDMLAQLSSRLTPSKLIVCLPYDWALPANLEDGARERARTVPSHVDLRSDLKPARTSSERSFGCSQAAKCPPLSSLL